MMGLLLARLPKSIRSILACKPPMTSVIPTMSGVTACKSGPPTTVRKRSQVALRLPVMFSHDCDSRAAWPMAPLSL